MAQMSKCCICEHYDFCKSYCEVYSNGIPEDIFVEIKPCNHFSKKQTDNSDDIPIAKGR